MYYIIITLLHHSLRHQKNYLKSHKRFRIISKTYALYSKSYIVYFYQPKLMLTVVSVVAKDVL